MRHKNKPTSTLNGSAVETVGEKTWEQIWAETKDATLESGACLTVQGYKTANEAAMLWHITPRGAASKLRDLVALCKYEARDGRHPVNGKPTKYYRPIVTRSAQKRDQA